eukprot:TRINITY_DN16172_c0_g1_i1.p1 TRINITY_DN16172_c0_g1~~TRINITY_DN16172_c0_g1_i1.p1  ORF type:complete len:226 (-),score=41.31 TRINITY_DN16172_c0_g1_i1:38-715(-)
MAYAQNISFAVDFTAARGRSPTLADLRTPSRTPSPMSTPFHWAMPSVAVDTVQKNYGGPACHQEEAPSTPRGKFGLPAELPQLDQETKEPRTCPWIRQASGSSVFSEETSGLLVLPQGWSTPDPSPMCSELPRSVAYTGVVMEKEGGTFEELNTRIPWADVLDDDAGFQTLSRGSAGHPYTCNEPCKYARKSRGCKEGINCDHCHACEWKKIFEKKKGKKASPSP